MHHFKALTCATLLFLAMGLAGGAVFAAPASKDPAITDPLFVDPVLNPGVIPKFVTPLPNPLDPGFIFNPAIAGPTSDTYNIKVDEGQWQILPAGYPQTPVWGYGVPGGPITFPGKTIEARTGRPVYINYTNELDNPNVHLLPVDPDVHCGPNTVDCQPFARIIPHLHGGHVGEESDGYPEAWWTPGAGQTGPFFFGTNFEYDNDQQAATLWIHDHSMGITRLNVYAGMALFYLLRDDNELALMDGDYVPTYPYEVPIVIQDRMFHPDGTLAYPDQIGLNGEISIEPEFFGQVIVVNGKSWPYMDVEPRQYRLRLLNGSNSRFYDLHLGADVPFTQIGSDGGLLAAPVTRDRILLGPAERADVVVDFSGVAGQTVVLRNNARSPFPKGATPNPKTEGQIMAFNVSAAPVADPVALPPSLNVIQRYDPLQADNMRDVVLFEAMDEFGRLRPQLGTITEGPRLWDEAIHPLTENIALGNMEMWRIVNTTVDAHPIHIHQVQFQVIGRQKYDIRRLETGTTAPDGTQLTTGDPNSLILRGNIKPPEPTEFGWKDTVIAYPGEVTTIMATFDLPGRYVWHCHILEHEDHEMMRPFYVN